MKLRKLLSMLAAAAVTTTYAFSSLSFGASAANTDRLIVPGTTMTIAEYISSVSGALTDITIPQGDGTVLYKEDMLAIKNDNGESKITFHITNDDGKQYTAVINPQDLDEMTLPDGVAGNLNLTLEINDDTTAKTVTFTNTTFNASSHVKIHYSIGWSSWSTIWDNTFGPITDKLSVYGVNPGGDDVFINVWDKAWGNCMFVLGDKFDGSKSSEPVATSNGLYFVYKPDDYILSKAEAKELIEDKLVGYLKNDDTFGTTAGADKMTLDEMANTLNTLDAIVDAMDLSTYVKAADLDAEIEKHFNKEIEGDTHNPKWTYKDLFVSSIIDDIGSIDTNISTEIYKAFGFNGTSFASASALRDALKENIKTDIMTTLNDVNSGITNIAGLTVRIADSKTVKDKIEETITNFKNSVSGMTLAQALDWLDTNGATLEDVVKANGKLDKLTQDVANANQTANNASQTANSASDKANAASDAAASASDKANAANSAATAASGTANEALNKANDALSEVDKLKDQVKNDSRTSQQIFEDWVNSTYPNGISGFIDVIAQRAATQVPRGKSAYEVAVDNGYPGTEKEWLKSLIGKDGQSAYEIACEYGFKGTEEQWIDSLRGENGLSAYEVAVENGFDGSELEWLNSLAGENSSVVYINGAYGPVPVDGEDGEDGELVYEDGEGVAPDSDEYVYIGDDDNESDDYGGSGGRDDDDYSNVDGEDAIILPGNTGGYYGGYDNSYNKNPATGVAIGIIIPAAAVGSVLLLKKEKRRRGRK